MDIAKIKESVCSIETEICALHQILATEEQGVSDKQADNSAMNVLVDLSRKFIDSHTDTPN